MEQLVTMHSSRPAQSFIERQVLTSVQQLLTLHWPQAVEVSEISVQVAPRIVVEQLVLPPVPPKPPVAHCPTGL